MLIALLLEVLVLKFRGIIKDTYELPFRERMDGVSPLVSGPKALATLDDALDFVVPVPMDFVGEHASSDCFATTLESCLHHVLIVQESRGLARVLMKEA